MGPVWDYDTPSGESVGSMRSWFRARNAPGSVRASAASRGIVILPIEGDEAVHSPSPSTTPKQHSQRSQRTERTRHCASAVPRPRCSQRPLRMLLSKSAGKSGTLAAEISAPCARDKYLRVGIQPFVAPGLAVLIMLRAPRDQLFQNSRPTGALSPLSGRSRFLICPLRGHPRDAGSARNDQGRDPRASLGMTRCRDLRAALGMTPLSRPSSRCRG
jgi:hypothetical protein